MIPMGVVFMPDRRAPGAKSLVAEVAGPRTQPPVLNGCDRRTNMDPLFVYQCVLVGIEATWTMVTLPFVEIVELLHAAPLFSTAIFFPI